MIRTMYLYHSLYLNERYQSNYRSLTIISDLNLSQRLIQLPVQKNINDRLIFHDNWLYSYGIFNYTIRDTLSLTNYLGRQYTFFFDSELILEDSNDYGGLYNISDELIIDQSFNLLRPIVVKSITSNLEWRESISWLVR